MLNTGSYTIDALYTDPNNPSLYNATKGLGTLAVNTANSALAVTATNSPISYDSTIESLDLTANVTSTNGGTVGEGFVVITVNGVSTGPIAVTGGTADGFLPLTGTSLLHAGNYPNGVSVSYADPVTNNYAPASATGNFAVTAEATTTTITSKSVSSTFNSTTPQTVTLTATVASATGGTVSEGVVTFTVGTLTATANVSGGIATTTLTLPAGFAAGSYTIAASYADSSSANYLSSTAGTSGALTVVAAPVGNTSVNNPVGSASVFAIGLGPTGIDWFEVDSKGEVFAQSYFGGNPQLVSTSLQFLLAVISDNSLLALLDGGSGPNYVMVVFDPFVPLVAPALFAALHL
jgi:hypothetical protein